MTGSDRDELQAVCTMVASRRPLLAALRDWIKAYDLTGVRVLDAAHAWAHKHATTAAKRIHAPDGVEAFNKFKNSKGNEGERTCGSKLKSITTPSKIDSWTR